MSIVPSNGQRATVLGLALALGSAVAQDTNQEVAFVVQNAEPVQEVTKPATPPADAKSSAVPANSTATQQPAAQPAATPVTKQVDASKPAPQAKPAEGKSADGTFTLSFTDQDFSEVFRFIAEKTGHSLLTEAKITDKFNFSSTRRYTLSEAINVINTVLYDKGAALVAKDNFLIVMDLKNTPRPDRIPVVDLKDLPSKGDMELVQIIYKLKSMKPEDAVTDFGNLVGRNTKMLPIKTGNQLVIIDLAKNVRQLVSMIEEIENGESKADFKQFRIKHVNALDVERVARDILGIGQRTTGSRAAGNGQAQQAANPAGGGGDMGRGGRDRFRSMFGGGGGPPPFMQMMMGGGVPGQPPQPGQPGAPQPGAGGAAGGDSSTTVGVDERTNTILVSGLPSKISMVEKIVEIMDVPQEEAPDAVKQQTKPRLYSVPAGMADGLSKMIENVFASPDIRTYPGADGRSIYVSATEREHERITDLFSSMARDVSRIEFEVLELKQLDATTVAKLIKATLGQKAEEDNQPRFPFFFGGFNNREESDEPKFGPQVEPEVENNRLIVRGSRAQIDEVKELLSRMGETHLSPKLADSAIRVFSTGDRDPRELAEILRNAWKQMKPGSELKVDVLPGTKTEESKPRENDRRRGEDGKDRRAKSDVVPTNSKATSARYEPVELVPEVETVHVTVADDGTRSSVSNALGQDELTGVVQLVDDPAPMNKKADEPKPTSSFPKMSEEEREKIIQEVMRRRAAEVATKKAETNAQQPATKPAPEPESLRAPSRRRPEGEAAPRTSGQNPAIVVGPDSIVISSDDPEERRQLVTLLESLLRDRGRGGVNRGQAVFDLRNANASDVAQKLEEALDITRNPFMQQTNKLKIVPDDRNNSILVIGSPADQKRIEDLLDILDRDESPESAALSQIQSVKLQHAKAIDVVSNLKDLYPDRIQTSSSTTSGSSDFGGFGGFFGGGRRRSTPTGKMSLTWDSNTNTVWIQSSKDMFDQIKPVIDKMDTAAQSIQEVARVVVLKNAAPEEVEQSLGSLFGVQTSERKQRAAGQQPGAGGQPNGENRPGGMPNFGGQGPPGMGGAGNMGGGGERGGRDRGGDRGGDTGGSRRRRFGG